MSIELSSPTPFLIKSKSTFRSIHCRKCTTGSIRATWGVGKHHQGCLWVIDKLYLHYVTSKTRDGWIKSDLRMGVQKTIRNILPLSNSLFFLEGCTSTIPGNYIRIKWWTGGLSQFRLMKTTNLQGGCTNLQGDAPTCRGMHQPAGGLSDL